MKVKDLTIKQIETMSDEEFERLKFQSCLAGKKDTLILKVESIRRRANQSSDKFEEWKEMIRNRLRNM